MAPSGNTGDAEKSLEFISTLPRDDRWMPLRQYQGFWLLDNCVLATLATCHRLAARPDDIFVASCPKSGTTWLKALVFCVVHRRLHPPGDLGHPLRAASPHDCVPVLEDAFTSDPDLDLEALPSPRIWAVHTPYSALPASLRDSGCKIVYVTRDPKDVFASLFHFRCAIEDLARTPLAMEEAFEMFCLGICPYGPIWEHALDYWNESLARPGKVLLLGYEEMKSDPLGSLRKLAAFLGCPFSPEEEMGKAVEEMSEFCSFRSLSGLEVNKEGMLEKYKSFRLPRKAFFRRGEVGDWRNLLSPEMAERLDVITKEKLRGTGLRLS